MSLPRPLFVLLLPLFPMAACLCCEETGDVAAAAAAGARAGEDGVRAPRGDLSATLTEQ